MHAPISSPQERQLLPDVALTSSEGHTVRTSKDRGQCNLVADQALPTPQAILKWLHFIAIQCPECGVADWPPLENEGVSQAAS